MSTNSPDPTLAQATQQSNAPAIDRRAAPNNNELAAAVYYAIGVGSEGSIGGRDVAYKLAFAGTIDPNSGRMSPVANSGFSLGTLQSDLGQRPHIPGELVNAYQNWAKENKPEWVLNDAQVKQTVRDLGRTGEEIRADGGRGLNGTIKSHLDEFLKTDAGIRYVHQNDTVQVEKVMKNVMEPLQKSSAYQKLNPDDQIMMAVIVAKAYNQSEKWGGRILDKIEDGQITTVAQTRDAVGALLKGDKDYMQTGRDHAMEGAKAFIALRNSDADNPLNKIYAGVVANPLADPTRSNGELRDQTAVMRDLFLQKGETPAFTAALNNNTPYEHGQRNKTGDRYVDDGLLTNGGNKFAIFDRTGKGFTFDGNQLEPVNRDDILRTKKGNDIDISIKENGQMTPFMEIGPRPAGQKKADAEIGGQEAASLASVLPEPQKRQLNDGLEQLKALGVNGKEGEQLMGTLLAANMDKKDLPVVAWQGPSDRGVTVGLVDQAAANSVFSVNMKEAKPLEESMKTIASAVQQQSGQPLAAQQGMETPNQEKAPRSLSA